MEQTQGTPPIRPHWYGRHKRLLLLGLGFLLLIAFFVIAGVYLILSGKIDRYIANQVREALGEYGLRAEMGKFDISWRNQTAKASDTKIYNQQSGQLIATVDQAELVVRILDPYALRLRRTIAFKQLELSNLNLWLETDAQGRSNLQGLHAAPPSPPGRITFDFSSLSGTLKGGTFHLNDRARKIEGELGGLQANARPLPGGTTAKAQLTGSRGHFLYQGRELTVDRIELALTGGAAGAEIESFTLRSPGVQASANGRIDDWDALRYGINIQAHLALAEVERIFEPGTGLSGTAQFNGRVEGERARYRITGELTSDGFTAAGARVYGAKVAGIGVESDGEQISFRSDQTFVQAVAVQGAKLTRLAAGAIRGGISNGRIRGDMPQLSIGLIEIAQGRISGVALQKATAGVAEDRYQLRGNLVVKNGAIGSASLGPLNGELIVDSETIALNKFKANLFGGSAAGDIAVQMKQRGRKGLSGNSHLKANFTGIKTGDIFTLVSKNPAPLAGTLDGNADLRWAGTDLLGANGTLTAHLSSNTTQTTDAISVRGDVEITANSGLFDVHQFTLYTDATRLTATGRISREGDSDLRASLTSTKTEELQTIAFSVEEVKKALEGYKPQLAGPMNFQGSITGPIRNPTIDANLDAGNISLHDQLLGSLTGHLLINSAEVRLDNWLLTAANHGALKFSYVAPRTGIATEGRLDATLDRFSSETLIAAAGFPNRKKFISGELSGEAHLTALTAAPQGTVTLNLIDGVIAGQRAGLATANLLLDGQNVRLEHAEVRLSQGRLVANGNFELKSNIFQLQGRVDSVDLGILFSSLQVERPIITGTATASLQASGNTENLDQLQVDLTANGENVTINGQAAGLLTLTARTSQNGRVDVDLTTGITGKPQHVRASIDLRKRERPIEVETDLTEFDLGQLIAASAPESAPSITGKVDGNLRLTGPTANERGETTLTGLHGDLRFTSISLQIAGRDINFETPLAATLRGTQVTLERTRVFGDGLDLSLGGTLALSKEAKMNFAANGTMNLDALSELSPAYLFGGTMTINARIEGSVNEPRLGGEIQVKGLTFSSPDPQLNIEDGNGRILLSEDEVTLESFTARANDGKINVHGALKLAQFQPQDWRFSLNASDIIVFYQGAQATLDGDLTLSGNPQGQLLSGNITIPHAEYTTDFDFENLGATGTGSLGSGGGGGGGRRRSTFGLSPLTLDLHVEANESLLIHNEQISTVGTAFLTVGGRLNEPSITGRVTFEGGTIRFRSQLYNISSGTLVFPAGAGRIPDVNAMAEGDVGNYHVYIGVSGPLNDMEVTLRSDPYLPQSSVLSLITTGRADSSSLANEDLARSGVGTAATLLSEQIISKPTESLLGLSRFQVDPVLRPNANPAARITIGKQVMRNMAFTYSTNLASEQDQTALLEYTLTNRFSMVGSFTQGGTSTQGGSTDNDLTIEMRARRRFTLGYSGGPSTTTPPRTQRTPLPHADVTVELPEGIRLSDRRMRQLLPVKQSGYSRPLALLGERNLTNYLQERGYFFATVSSRCEPANCSGPNLRLHYAVNAGERHALEDIRIEGTDRINVGDLKGNLQSQAASFIGRIPVLRRVPLIGGSARGITSNERLQRDREVIRRLLVNQGFRSAHVTSRLASRTESGDLIVIFDVNEGPRSIISGVTIKGNAVITSSELRATVPLIDNEPFSITKVRAGTENIKKFYEDHGYLDVTVEVNILDLPPDYVRVVYQVTEGNRSVASEIPITGQTKTREDSIRRFLDIDPGTTLTPQIIRRTQRDLYSTGAFSEVNISTEPVGGDDPNARRVTVGVTEAKPLLLVYGIGYSTEDGPRGLLQLSHTNFFGRANNGSIRLRASGRELLGQVSYIDLRPFDTKWATTISAYYDHNNNLQSIVRQQIVDGSIQNEETQSYGINRFVAFIQSERKLSEITSVRLRYSYEDSRLSNIQNIPLEEIGRNDRPIRLGLFSAGFTRDTRDSALNPTRGQLFSAEYSVATRILGGNESFNKFFGNYQYYRTLPQSTPWLRDTVLAATARVGLSAPFKVTPTGTFDDKQLPISERFFAGGATTLRGFGYEAAGPQAILEPRFPAELPALVPVGGNALTVFNFELRYPLTRNLRLVPFYDLGNIFPLVSDIRFGGMTNSVGLGLRVNTPIGPVGVDYGFLIDPPSFVSATGAVLTQPRGAIHIRFGQSF